MPGTDIAEAIRVVLGELPDLPHLPELPARGPGADMVGRGAALLVDLPVELYAARWRVAARPGADLRTAKDFLERDLDTLTDQAAEYRGTMKLQAVGAWTLATSLDRPTGGAMLRDTGATRDLAASLAEGLREHLAEVGARLPGASLILQLDEPALPAVLAGAVPTESGLSALPAVDPAVVREQLASVVQAVGVPVIVHCCAPSTPIRLIQEAGAAAVALDLALIDDLDELGAVLDAGLGLFAGAADSRRLTARGPSVEVPPNAAQAMADRLRRIWRVLALPASRLPHQAVVNPACGLADLPTDRARAVLTACREAGRRLADEG